MQALIYQEAHWWTPVAPAMTSSALCGAMPANPKGPSAGPWSRKPQLPDPFLFQDTWGEFCLFQ